MIPFCVETRGVVPALANAPRWDATQQNMVLVLTCIASVAVVAAMVGLISVLARRRRHPAAQPLAGVAVVWGMVTAASVVYTATVQLSWQKSHALEMLSGYGDSQELPPAYPWVLWMVLLAAYVLLLGVTLSARPKS